MPDLFCEYCGYRASSVRSLTASTCVRHPESPHRGRHKLFEGTTGSGYTCRYCGLRHATLSSLTASTCVRHPKGAHKGRHAPAR